MDYDTFDSFELLMAPFPGVDESEFGRSREPPPTIPLAQAMEGKPLSSQCVFFTKLPLEVLDVVMKCLDQDGLANFALLNNDCRQLARTHQFSSWSCDYVSLRLFALLQSEAEERVNNDCHTYKPSLGACIRSMTIATDAQKVMLRHNIDMGNFPNDDAGKFRADSASDIHFGLYLGALGSILRRALPNLETILWRNQHPLSPSLLKAIVASPVKTLDLGRIGLNERSLDAFMGDDITRVPSRLERLELSPVWSFSSKSKMPTYPFVCRFLQHCASSLRALYWEGILSDHTDDKDLGPMPFAIPDMVELRNLALGGIRIQSLPDIQALILPLEQCKLAYLDVDRPRQLVRDYMSDYGEMPTLKALIWDYDQASFSAMEAFLHNNKGLEQFACTQLPEIDRDFRLLPLLSSTYDNLLSLEIGSSSEVTSFSFEALSSIAQIKTLRRLHLTAGCQAGWRTDWLVDHESIRACISKLPLLQVLALSRDIYDPLYDPQKPNKPSDMENVQRYYSMTHRMPNIDEAEQRLMDWCIDVRYRELETINDTMFVREWSCEMKHRRRMLKEGNKYARLRQQQNGPELEMLYIGQLPMKIEDRPKGQRIATALTEKRDGCWTWLRKVFRGRQDLSDDLAT